MAKRTIATMVAAAGLLGVVGAVGAVLQPSAQAAPNSAHAPVQPRGWEEDSLPPQLYLWMEVMAEPGHAPALVGPKIADKWVREATGGTRHRGCWAALGSTTLVMCPDGFQMYS